MSLTKPSLRCDVKTTIKVAEVEGGIVWTLLSLLRAALIFRRIERGDAACGVFNMR